MNVVALIPAFNEEATIGGVVEALLAQERVPDRIVVIPNGCADGTAEVARQYPVTVMELPRLKHRKAEALNRAWREYAQDADMVVCLDADTILPPNAVGDWERELAADARIGGSSSKFTMLTARQSRAVLPPLPRANHADAGSTDSIPLSKRIPTAPVFWGGSDHGNVFGSQSCRTSWSSAAPISDHHVTHVVSVSSWDQVINQEAQGIVTDVTNHRHISGAVEVLPYDVRRATTSDEGAATLVPDGCYQATVSVDSMGHKKLVIRESRTGDDLAGLDQSLVAGSAELSPNDSGRSTLTLDTVNSHDSILSSLLTRLQKAEFSTWTDTALRRGSTHVLAGTGCAIRGTVLAAVAARDDRDGPWCYDSATEDFELTYRIRELGFRCQVSPTVRAYTDSMRTVRALWGQRTKWQVGTVEDLLRFGVNRLTLLDWWQQAFGMMNAALKLLLLVVIFGNWAVFGYVSIMWVWFLFPLLFVALEVKRAMRIPHRDWKDVAIAASFFPNEAFMWLRSGWFVKSWWDVAWSKVTGDKKDRWSAQYQAERMAVV